MESQPIYQFGRFHLDVAERVLLADGKAVALAPKLFDTLLALVANAGRILAKKDLLQQIWPDSYVEENSLNKNVHALRRLLGGKEAQESYIETIPKRGYRFSAEVRHTNAGATTLSARRTRTHIVIEEEIEEGKPLATKIAVLPFRTLGSEADDHLGLGLADTLITRLSHLSLIQVRPTSAIVQLAGQPFDSLAVGRELQVDAVLDGSIRRAGEHLRVNVQLVSVAHDTPLWAEKFDEQFTNIFAVEDAIAEQVADALLLKLTSAQRHWLTKRETTSVAAYELYLRGLQQLHAYSATAMRQAIPFFTAAARQDPQYALAQVRLASCYTLLYIYSHGVPAPQLAQLAQAAAARALELDDSLAEAHAAASQTALFCLWQPAEALVAARRAVALNPHGTFPNLALSWALAAHGQVEEAVTALRRVQQLAPHSPALNVSLGHLLAFARRYDEAAGFYHQVLSAIPAHADALRGLGMVNLLCGHMNEVAPLLTAEPSTGQAAIVALLRAMTCACQGDEAGARAALQAGQSLPTDAYLRSIYVAAIYAALDSRDEAFAWLERAWAEHEPMLITLQVHPFLSELRDDPRFGALRRRLGFTEEQP